MDKDNAKLPGDKTNTVEFESKNIKRTDNKRLFNVAKEPKASSALKGTGEFFSNIFSHVGKFFKRVWDYLKSNHVARIAIIIIVIAVPLGLWVLIKGVLPGDITIGDITITRQDINTYTRELSLYQEINGDSGVTQEDSEKKATEFLIKNAAYQHYAKNDCSSVEVDLSYVEEQHPDEDSFYLRIPAENSAYEAQLEQCLIADKDIFSIMINYDTLYFSKLEQAAREEAFAAAKQRLISDYLPLFEQGLSVDDIAAKADVKYFDINFSTLPGQELWEQQAVVTAAYDKCRGDATSCFNDIDGIDYGADLGQIYSMAEKIQSLNEVGEYTDVFPSKTGTFAILRLEEKSEGLFNTYDELYASVNDKYVKKDLITRLFAFVAKNIFGAENAYAATPEIVKINAVTGSGYSVCSQNNIRFHFRAIDEAGLHLGGWKMSIQQNESISAGDIGCANCERKCNEVTNGVFGPNDGGPITGYDTAPMVEFTTTCVSNTPPNFGTTNFVDSKGSLVSIGASLSVSSIVTQNPEGATPKHLVMRKANDSAVDVFNPGQLSKDVPFPWAHIYINERGLEGNGMIFVYKRIEIANAGYKSQAAATVKAINGQSVTRERLMTPENSRAESEAPEHIKVTDGKANINITFEHFLNYTGPITVTSSSPSCKSTDTTDPCTPWKVDSNAGDIKTPTPTPPIAASETAVTTYKGGYAVTGSEGTFQRRVAFTDNQLYVLPAPTEGTTATHKICQTINYTYSQFKGVTPTTYSAIAGTGAASTVCIVVQVSHDDVPIVVTPGTSCPLGGEVNGRLSDINMGGTKARSGVINKSRSTGIGWVETNADTGKNSVFVWAKPGDNVQFRHQLCFGAQAVRGSRDPGGGFEDDPDRPLVPSPNSATIEAYAYTNNTKEAKQYLFGKTLATTAAQNKQISMAAGESRPVAADQVSDYYFTYYSPSINPAAGETFKCDPFRQSPFVTNSYQIPGFKDGIEGLTNGNCGPKQHIPTASDAGKTIEQDFIWANVQAWVNTQNGGYIGSCGCAASTASAHNEPVNYGDSAGNYGSRQYSCKEIGKCGKCCDKYCTSLCDTEYDDDYKYRYFPISTSSAQGATQITQVKIPYNFTTAPTVTLPDLPVVYGGGDTTPSVDVGINPRPNTDVSDKEYATISKPAAYDIVAFTVNRTASPTAIKHETAKEAGQKTKEACTYYRTSAVMDCLSIDRKIDEDTRFNTEGSLDGSIDNIFNNSISVPDLEVGTKFCVAVGVWPSDSHDAPDTEVKGAGADDIALTDSGKFWHYSEPTCRTVAKKPMTYFEGAGIYTRGGIITSQTKKTLDYRLGMNGNLSGLLSTSEQSGQRRVFGSWSEYEAVAKGSINGFASGATFGWDRNNGGSLPAISRSSNPSDYFSAAHNADPELCTYSTQTFSNDSCSDGKTAGLSTINSMSATLIARLLSRYAPDDVAPNQPSGRNLDLGGVCVWDNRANDGKGDFVPSESAADFDCLDNGAKYVKVDGNATIPSGVNYCMGMGDTINSRTSIVEVSGTLTIDTNLTYGNLLSSGCGRDTYTSISQLPQQIIIAGNINITSNVNNIDAWLIVGQNSSGEGTINTCSDVQFSSLDANKCNQKLTVNGPVYANKLILNRTAGAGVGSASINPAEVFNLRPDTYLWAYNQAQRFSQAVTTYSRELAPRY